MNLKQTKRIGKRVGRATVDAVLAALLLVFFVVVTPYLTVASVVAVAQWSPIEWDPALWPTEQRVAWLALTVAVAISVGARWLHRNETDEDQP